MGRAKRHMDLGLRWIRCGWRLFLRNPWQLGGMGFCCAAVAVGLIHIPLIGGPLLGLLAPPAVAAFYIAIEEISKQKIKLPRALRFFAIKQSPREFLNVARDERHLMQVLVLGLCGMIVFVLTDVLTWFIAGTALASPLANLSFGALVAVTVATIVRIAIYLILAATLVYAIPLALLRQEPLVPAFYTSLCTSAHYGFALLTIVALVVGLFVIISLTAFGSPALAYLGGLAAGVFVLPIALCSCYCSYRAIFAVANAAAPAPQPLRSIKDVA